MFKEKDYRGHDVKRNYTDEQGPRIDLSITNCQFKGLKTGARGGSAIYIMRPGNVVIDDTTVFEGNHILRTGERYGGGGVLWLSEISPTSQIKIGGLWKNNKHNFQHGVWCRMDVLNSVVGINCDM